MDFLRYRKVRAALVERMHRDSVDPTIEWLSHLDAEIRLRETDVESIAKLLVAKGLITKDELWKAKADGMEELAAAYEVAMKGIR